MVVKFRLAILTFLLFFSFHFSPGAAQNTPQEEASQLFEAGNYSEALPVFKRLITLFPKDPRYQYFAGVCMIETNTSLAKAIEYLTFASEKAVPRDVYFYLGKAYHLLYRFDEALDSYLKFQQFGERLQKDKLQCDMHINMARNGKRIFEQKVEFDIIQVDSMTQDHLFEFYNIRSKNGKFREKTLKTFSFLDPSETSWSFYPSMTITGQEVFETTLSGIKKNKDISVIRKMEGDRWSKPENAGGVINSPFDEDYAFFDINESCLYFASKGHNSMGGYDIFKSIYNPDTKTWSEPVNMGYPINSPYDDFLFVPEDNQKACFVSTRESHGNLVKVYTISFSHKESKQGNSGLKTNVSEVKKNSEVGNKQVIQKKEETLKQSSSEKKETESYPKQLAEHKEYDELLQLALRYQIQADSASRVAEEIRQQLPSAKNEVEASKMKRDIYLLEQQSKTTQVKADELYKEARKYEIMVEESAPKFTNEMAKKAFASQPEKTQASQIQKKVIYEFRIMANSPYKTLSDIPIDKPLPEGLLYRIQMGAFSKPIEPDRFKGIVPIYGETLKNSVVKYYAGMFSRMADADKVLIKIREYGFKDAFIVSAYNGKGIPLNRAKELEKENE